MRRVLGCVALMVLAAACMRLPGQNTNNNGGGGGGGGGSSSSSSSGGGSSLPDPAADRTEPGEYTCDGCPDTDISDYEVNAGNDPAYVFEGTVEGADGDGTFYVDGPGEEAVTGTIETDPETGAFTFATPLFCGTQLVKCLWSNEQGTYVAVVEVITEGCINADIRVTLTWEQNDADWDLHFVRPGGAFGAIVNDCNYTTCIGQRPDWGVEGNPNDDPAQSIDDTNGFGPEDIFLANPEDGTYTVYVKYYSEPEGVTQTNGQVVINVNGQPSVVPITGLVPEHVRAVASVEWPSGTVTPLNNDYDCSSGEPPEPLVSCN